MDQRTDEELVELIRQGHADTEIYRILVERYYVYIFNLIYRMVHHRETAEDLAQEVFIRIYRSIPLFRGEASFKTWIYRITLNLVADDRKSRQRKPRLALLDKFREQLSGKQEEEPESQILMKEEQQQIHAAFAKLPEKYRVIMYLYHFQQCSYQEISEIMQLPIKAVETRLYRGKKLLKQKWLEVNRHAPITKSK